MPTDFINTSDLCRHYHRGQHVIKAVDGVNVGISKGDFLAVVGASGSGKSTLLNLLAGLDSPTSGTINYMGQILSALSGKELSAYRAAKVGMIFQSFNLLPYQTAHKNVELALYFQDVPRRDRLQKTTAILERLGLEAAVREQRLRQLRTGLNPFQDLQAMAKRGVRLFAIPHGLPDAIAFLCCSPVPFPITA